jgi:hypothetical protein
MLNDAFLSIVAKDCARDELMVRARRPGDIEKIFPGTVVTEYTASDYHYRAAVKKDAIKAAMCGEIDRIGYANFKSSTEDRPLHDAYMRVWHAMAALQPKEPYSGRRMVSNASFFDFGESQFDTPPAPAKPKAKKSPAKLKKGQ